MADFKAGRKVIWTGWLKKRGEADSKGWCNRFMVLWEQLNSDSDSIEYILEYWAEPLLRRTFSLGSNKGGRFEEPPAGADVQSWIKSKAFLSKGTISMERVMYIELDASTNIRSSVRVSAAEIDVSKMFQLITADRNYELAVVEAGARESTLAIFQSVISKYAKKDINTVQITALCSIDGKLGGSLGFDELIRYTSIISFADHTCWRGFLTRKSLLMVNTLVNESLKGRKVPGRPIITILDETSQKWVLPDRLRLLSEIEAWINHVLEHSDISLLLRKKIQAIMLVNGAEQNHESEERLGQLVKKDEASERSGTLVREMARRKSDIRERPWVNGEARQHHHINTMIEPIHNHAATILQSKWRAVGHKSRLESLKKALSNSSSLSEIGDIEAKDLEETRMSETIALRLRLKEICEEFASISESSLEEALIEELNLLKSRRTESGIENGRHSLSSNRTSSSERFTWSLPVPQVEAEGES